MMVALDERCRGGKRLHFGPMSGDCISASNSCITGSDIDSRPRQFNWIWRMVRMVRMVKMVKMVKKDQSLGYCIRRRFQFPFG